MDFKTNGYQTTSSGFAINIQQSSSTIDLSTSSSQPSKTKDSAHRDFSQVSSNDSNVPWFVTKRTLHTDLGVSYVKEAIKKQAIKYHERLQWHPNKIVNPLQKEKHGRRLKTLTR
ncbi:hypothetical protein ILUMI_22634 [Ignelater luminosus]|uniref:Uncharacterized protein n=1 Tax=Ignelater luminosus TaxID=2038154 RepID=A0A8K0CGT5_IGNLU|nr:hypothetical protein ILUMI_22634 [Ignelater luminosus]